MSDLTAKFTALESQLTDEATATAITLASILDALSVLNTAVDTLNNNGATNTRYLLDALGQNGACFPCPTPSIVVPIVPTTGIAVNSDKCKRAQAIVATIHKLLSAIDVLQSYNVTATFGVLNDAISQVIATIAAGDTIPLPSFPETVQLVGAYFNYVGERIFSGVSLLSQFEPLEGDLVSAIYIAGGPSSSQAAYNASIGSSSISTAGKQLITAIAYNALWSYYFDPASTPDLSGFDGTTCTSGLHDLTACAVFTGDHNPSSGSFSQYMVHIAPLVSYDGNFMAGDFFGWSIQRIDSGGGVVKTDATLAPGSYTSPHFLVATDPPTVVTDHTAGIRISTVEFGGSELPFTVRICPPA